MERLAALRQQLQAENREAILITNPINVAYLSGFTGTAGMLFITEDKAALMTDFRYLEQAAQQAPAYEVVDVAGDSWKRLAELLHTVGCSMLAVEADHLTVDTYNKINAAVDGITVQPIISPVVRLRAVKSAAEIAAIESAQKIADEAFTEILSIIKPGVRERDIALELEFIMRKKGASGLSFTMIVGSGSRSALPHGVASDKVVAAGDAVVLDFGCIVDGYCSDMTRTVFVSKVSDKQRRIYEFVLEAQQTALAGLRAGMSGREGDALARDVLVKAGLGDYFGHGLGHGVGREIHEAPRLSVSSQDTLQPKMVVTVEPGVYLPGEFGVRIEDMVVVEENGIRNLTASTKELICL